MSCDRPETAAVRSTTTSNGCSPALRATFKPPLLNRLTPPVGSSLRSRRLPAIPLRPWVGILCRLVGASLAFKHAYAIIQGPGLVTTLSPDLLGTGVA